MSGCYPKTIPNIVDRSLTCLSNYEIFLISLLHLFTLEVVLVCQLGSRSEYIQCNFYL